MGSFCRAVFVKDEDLTGGQWRSTGSWWPGKKFSCQSGLYLTLFFLFFSKERGKTKQKPSNAKYVHIKKYRFLKAKDNHFENAIDFVWERFLWEWPNLDDDRFAGRAPVKSKMTKCMGFAAHFGQWHEFERNNWPRTSKNAFSFGNACSDRVLKHFRCLRLS